MAHWSMMTMPAKGDGPLTGTYADGDMRFRLVVLVDMITKATAALAEARRAFDVDVEAAKKNGQQRLVDEALARLAERRGR